MENRFENQIQYSGNVTLKIKQGNGVVRILNAHNSGALPLYKFLAICLAGDYRSAELLRPYKVKLFKIELEGEQALEGLPPKEPLTQPKFASTEYIPLAEAPMVKLYKDNNFTITSIHFVIPYTYIDEGYNQVCLYSINAKDNDDYCAYYFLTDEKGKLRTEEVEADSNYNLLIDWDLKVSGPEVE